MKEQPKYRFAEDNETGKGSLIRTRNRDGAGR